MLVKILKNKFLVNVISAKCKFWQVKILEIKFSENVILTNVISEKQVWGKCNFRQVLIEADVTLGNCSFWQM